MAIPVSDAFLVLDGWKENQTPLVIMGMFSPEFATGPVVHGVVVATDASLGFVRVRVGAPGSGDIVLKLTEASFDILPNSGDPSRNAVGLTAILPDQQVIVFSERPAK
ncbi:MAG TPA: hypothetical protein VIH76_06390 [Candidatus Acidoferrales bacterium]